MKENNELYVNAPYIIQLIECIQLTAKDRKVYETAEEIKNIIYEHKWIELN